MFATSEWGLAGLEAFRDKVSVLVIIDVLSFSTAVDIATSRGVIVYPFQHGDEDAAQRAADQVGALLAKSRKAAGGQLSLSPASLMALPAGTKLMLPSPNGSRLSLAGGHTPVLAGCLRNARSVAKVACRLAGGGIIAVVPAGERWPDGSLRPAIEDLLGAGAVLHHLACPCSPEAQVARDAYRTAEKEIAILIQQSVSGRELIERGYFYDVKLAVEQNVSGYAPLLQGGAYHAVRG